MGTRISIAAAGASLALALSPIASAGSIRIDTSAFPTVGVTVVLPGDPSTPPLLFENGRHMPVQYAAAFRSAKNIALVVDRSRSMHGEALATARTLALRLSADREPGDRIAVFAIGSKAVQLTPFSASPSETLTALRHMRLDHRYGTALYDGIALAADSIRREHARNGMIILVTDGQDINSSDDITEASTDAAEAHAPIYPVGIRNGSYQPVILDTLARTTYGAFFGAVSPTAAYDSIAAHIRNTWRLEYRTEALPGQLVKIRVSQHGYRPLRLRVRMPGHPPPNPWRVRELVGLIAGAVFVALLLLVLATRKRRPLQRW